MGGKYDLDHLKTNFFKSLGPLHDRVLDSPLEENDLKPLTTNIIMDCLMLINIS